MLRMGKIKWNKSGTLPVQCLHVSVVVSVTLNPKRRNGTNISDDITKSVFGSVASRYQCLHSEGIFSLSLS